MDRALLTSFSRPTRVLLCVIFSSIHFNRPSQPRPSRAPAAAAAAAAISAALHQLDESAALFLWTRLSFHLFPSFDFQLPLTKPTRKRERLLPFGLLLFSFMPFYYIQSLLSLYSSSSFFHSPAVFISAFFSIKITFAVLLLFVVVVVLLLSVAAAYSWTDTKERTVVTH